MKTIDAGPKVSGSLYEYRVIGNPVAIEHDSETLSPYPLSGYQYMVGVPPTGSTWPLTVTVADAPPPEIDISCRL
jgi:hypothetical protein